MKQNKQEQWEKEFDKKFSVLKYEQDGEHHEGFRVKKVPNSKDIKQFISNLISQTRQEAVEEVKQKCKKIYIDEVDWSEWGISDEEAGENFEREYEELSQEKK